ncbi:hypothetical protein SLEP1_g17569 [Rubroshorea leprosula]|uniref:Uncharacterized protein n=1 Tax=Rubroshorea leprosula TaxID=152421 RepID=A0AAV5IUR8_9ROSI|nr:hypothetical protein SLEP1_g17569 [Rubroshorea leprosula]
MLPDVGYGQAYLCGRNKTNIFPFSKAYGMIWVGGLDMLSIHSIPGGTRRYMLCIAVACDVKQSFNFCC